MFLRILCSTLFFLSFLKNVNGQQVIVVDTTTIKNTPKEVVIDSLSYPHSPRKATLSSALLPGLGQAYNKKYWKIPVIYGALAVTGYFIHYNNVRYHKYNNELIARSNGDTANFNSSLSNLDESAIKSASDDYRRFRDLDIMIAALIYVLNIVDAHVDAHLFYFNVDDDLSLRVTPELHVLPNYTIAPNLSLKFNF